MWDTLDVLWWPLLGGLLVVATHVPLGREVLRRGIVFIDLAIAQVAGVGVVLAVLLGYESQSAAATAAAFAAALAAAALLHYTEGRVGKSQEALIGVLFVLAASVATLLVADLPHGARTLREVLEGQILWVTPPVLAVALAVYALVLGLWWRVHRKPGGVFYLLFALAIPISVQLVGVYLVFATLIVPALATRELSLRPGLIQAYAVGVGAYAAGLALSLGLDLPASPLIVIALAAIALAARLGRRRGR